MHTIGSGSVNSDMLLVGLLFACVLKVESKVAPQREQNAKKNHAAKKIELDIGTDIFTYLTTSNHYKVIEDEGDESTVYFIDFYWNSIYFR